MTDVPVDGGTPDAITYPHPRRRRTVWDDPPWTSTRTVHAVTPPPDSPEWEPAEHAPCTRCGDPVHTHDVHGGCPPTSDDGHTGTRRNPMNGPRR